MSTKHLVAALAALTAACATTPQPAPAAASSATATATRLARAALEARSGSSLGGQAVFTREGEGVRLSLDVAGVPPGTHAVHLHEKGDCSAPDATSAGAHWNPEQVAHGKFGEGAHHLGDVGNLAVDADGKGTLTFTTDRWEVGTGGVRDVVGKALIVHATKDDFATQPTGAAGGRIGCGVVTLAE